MSEFEKVDEVCRRSGLPCNLEALLPKECKHEVDSWVSPRFKDNFAVSEKICCECGKTLEIKVEIVKEA